MPPQPTPKANVDVLAAALKKVGFQPEVLTDVSQVRLRDGINGFLAQIQPRDFVLFYFSGYGYQDEDLNYLVPVDFDPKDTDAPAGSKAYGLDLLLRQLRQRQAGTKMIVLDASRPCKGVPEQCRGLSEGLAQPQQPSLGTLLAFSAPANQPMEDSGPGPDRFTAALAEAIPVPGADPRGILDKAQAAASAGSPPLVLTTVVPRFYFIDPPKEAPKTVVVEKIVKPELRPGDTHVNPKDQMVYSWIPAGKFQMGCVPGDAQCDKDESPRHEVTISNAFWITSTEVTAEAYTQYSQATGHPDAKKSQLGHKGLATDVPVIKVTWDDANDYCKYAGGRLPTEAEWEYAARGGNPDFIFPWGAEPDPKKAVAYEMVNNKEYRKLIAPYTETVPVKKLQVFNGYRLLGMAGNAAEWTADFYGPYTAEPATDPAGAAKEKDRVVRGGSWNDPLKFSRITARDHHPPNSSENTIGFRCVVPSFDDSK